MRRSLSVKRLAVAAWASCLLLEGLLAAMACFLSWYPHFLPVTAVLALVIVTGFTLLMRAAWQIVRGPGRERALAWLLIGTAPFFFLAGHFRYGSVVRGGRNQVPDPLLRTLVPLRDSLIDVEARLRYPQRTYGQKVVMITAAMPQTTARADVAAMDRHIRKMEERLGRSAKWAVYWVRGPILGHYGVTCGGLSVCPPPGEQRKDAGGLGQTDRHETGHAMIASLCPATADPPAVLVEGWADANMGQDPVDMARRLKDDWERGDGFTLRRLTQTDWYHRHQIPVYLYGAPLVDLILHRFGPQKFLELYSTCGEKTFDADCRRILGLGLDDLDAALRVEIDRLLARTGSVSRHRLERLRLDPRVDATTWKTFLADYFAAAERMKAANHQVRLKSIGTWSKIDSNGRPQGDPYSYEDRLLRCGDLASLRHRVNHFELAYLSHPKRSIFARRQDSDHPWLVEEESGRTPEQARRRILHRIDILDAAGHEEVAPLVTIGDGSGPPLHGDHVVAAFERFSEKGRPRVRIRIEDRWPMDWEVPWRAKEFVLAADESYATVSERSEGVDKERKTYESAYVYDTQNGIPVLRSKHTMITAPDGSHETAELKVVERRVGPIPDEEFDPDRFLTGPQATYRPLDPYSSALGTPSGRVWPLFAMGAISLVTGTALLFWMRTPTATTPAAERRAGPHMML